MPRWRLKLYVVVAVIVGILVYLRFSQEPSRTQGDSDRESPTTSRPVPADRGRAGSVSDVKRQRASTVDPLTASESKKEPDTERQLAVLVVDQVTQSPVKDALIALFEAGSQGGLEDAIETAATDSRGRAGFDPQPGDYEIAVSHRQYLAARDSVALAPDVPSFRTISLSPAISVGGRVTDREGLPVPSARIRLSSRNESHTEVETLSSADGSFQVWVEAGRHDLTAQQDGFGETVMHGIDVWPGRRFVVEVILDDETPTIPLSGTVRSESGPVQDAVVQAQAQGRNTNTQKSVGNLNQPVCRIAFYHSTRTDQRGRFKLDLPRGDYFALRITAPGHETLSEVIDLRAVKSKTFELHKERGFVVTVVDSRGNTVRGLEVVGFNAGGRQVLRRLTRVAYSSSEYPVQIYAVDPQTGIPVSGKVQLSDYRSEVSLALATH